MILWDENKKLQFEHSQNKHINSDKNDHIQCGRTDYPLVEVSLQLRPTEKKNKLV